MRCNRKKLAEILGHDVKTIDKMVASGMPYVSRPGDGQRSWVFDTAAILRWMLRDEYAERAKDYRSRIIEAKAGLKWLEYGQALGVMVRIDDLVDKLIEIPQMLKSRLYAIPGRFDQLVANETDPVVIERMLQEELDDIFAEMDRMAETLVNEPARAAAAAAKRAGYK